MGELREVRFYCICAPHRFRSNLTCNFYCCTSQKAVAIEAEGFGTQKLGQLEELHACIRGLGELCNAQLTAARSLMSCEGLANGAFFCWRLLCVNVAFSRNI